MSLPASSFGLHVSNLNYVWNVGLLETELMQQPVIEGGTIVIGTVDQGAPGAVPWSVTISGSTTVTGTVAATQSGTWVLGANSGVDIGDVTINNASIAITAAALPLPSNAAQETGGNLASISTSTAKIPALGQALAAGSVPVVLTAAQLATLTPLSAVTVTGSVTANAGTNLNTSALALDASITTLNTSVNTLLKPANTLAKVTTVDAVTQITNALPAGTNLLGKVGIDQTTPGTTNKVSIGTDGTVAITGSVAITAAALPLPANAAIEAGGNLESIDDKLTSGIVISSMPASTTGADVLEADGDADYTDGELAQAITQTPDGRLRVAAAGLVSEVPLSFIDGQVRSLSMTTEGRLRVSTVPAYTELEVFREPESLFFDVPVLTQDQQWIDVANNPWGF